MNLDLFLPAALAFSIVGLAVHLNRSALDAEGGLAFFFGDHLGSAEIEIFGIILGALAGF
ncbi:hypothetical protein D3C73_1529610 [compost metagenome]